MFERVNGCACGDVRVCASRGHGGGNEGVEEGREGGEDVWEGRAGGRKHTSGGRIDLFPPGGVVTSEDTAVQT